MQTFEFIPKIPEKASDLLNDSSISGTTVKDALNNCQPLDSTLTGLAGLDGTTGFLAETAADTFVKRTWQNPAAGATFTNPGGVAGNPSIVFANDLGALEGLGSTGIAVRTATDTWAQRSIVAGSAKISVSNGSGVAGNPGVDLGAVAASDLTNGVTGSGAIVLATNPTVGALTVSSINKMAVTAPATSSTLAVADGKTFTASNTLTLAGTDGSTLNVGAGGTLAALAFKASVDCSTSDVTGTLAAGRFPAMLGDVTNTAGSLTNAIGANKVTYAKFQQVSGVSLLGNPTGSAANVSEITLGTSLQFSSTTLNTIQGIRTSDSPQFTKLGLGTAPTSLVGLKAFPSCSGGAGQIGLYMVPTFDSSCTDAQGMSFSGSTAAAAFTVNDAASVVAQDWLVGSGSAITRLIGFRCNPLTGGANNWGFRGQVASSAALPFNCYMDGTAPNYFNGAIQTHTGTALGKADIRTTSGAQIVGSYDAADYVDVTVNLTGTTTITAHGTNPSINLVTSGTGGVQINGGAKKLKELTATASLSGFGTIAANSVATQTITVTGAAVGDDVSVTPGGSLSASGLVWSAYVSASNTVTVILANVTAGSLTPSTVTWRAVVRSF